MRSPRDFFTRPAAEQRALARDTWCDVCCEPDLGLIDPVEYEDDGVLFLAGLCVRCGGEVKTIITETNVQHEEGQLQPYAVVKVRCLREDESDYDGWKTNQRSPSVGDIGTVLDVLKASNAQLKYVVECLSPDGRTLWLSEFTALELEAVRSDA